MSRKSGHYVVRIANDICQHIALGETLEGALKKIGYLAPSMPTVWRWMAEHEDFKDRMDMARQMQADTLADKTLDMVKDVLKDPKSAPAYRVAVDILRWHAGIRNGKTYNPQTNDNQKAPPLDANKIKAEIKRLEKELGVQENKVVKLAPKATGTLNAKADE